MPSARVTPGSALTRSTTPAPKADTDVMRPCASGLRTQRSAPTAPTVFAAPS